MYCAVSTAFTSNATIYLKTKTTRNCNIFPISVEYYFKILYLCIN